MTLYISSESLVKQKLQFHKDISFYFFYQYHFLLIGWGVFGARPSRRSSSRTCHPERSEGSCDARSARPLANARFLSNFVET